MSTHCKLNNKSDLNQMLINLTINKKGVEIGAEQYQDEGKLFIRVSSMGKFEINSGNQKYLSEKLYEELFAEDEPMLPTHNPKISIAQVAENNIELLIPEISNILESLYSLSDQEVIENMQRIVPGYKKTYQLINP